MLWGDDSHCRAMDELLHSGAQMSREPFAADATQLGASAVQFDPLVLVQSVLKLD